MAIRLSPAYSAPTVNLSHASIKGSRNTRSVMMSACASSNHHHGSVDLQTSKSSDHKIIKVYEDRAEGIVCYKDENGEVTCEGYDEGPRLDHRQIQMPRCAYNPSIDVETLEMLQRCLPEDNELKDTADKDKEIAGGAKQKYFQL